jgi:hypothetical protein
MNLIMLPCFNISMKIMLVESAVVQIAPFRRTFCNGGLEIAAAVYQAHHWQ